MTPKNKITTQKNLIDMKQMTLNDPKFDIKKSLDNLLYPLQYAKWLSKQQGKQQLCIHLLYESLVEQCEYTTQPKCSFWYHAIDAKGAVLKQICISSVLFSFRYVVELKLLQNLNEATWT